jgi:ribose transport system permease protein
MKEMMARLRGYDVPIIVLVIVWAYFSTRTSTFLGSSGVFATLQGFALAGLVALGIGVTVIAGELDFAVVSIAAFSAVVAVKVAPLGLVPALLAATAVGACIGISQGVIIARFNISSMAFTLGTMIFIQGLASVLVHNGTIVIENLSVADGLIRRFGVLSPAIVIALLAFVVVGALMAFTKVGSEVYAIGGGRAEARAAGVPVGRPVVFVFAISGTCGGLAGALSSIQSGSASTAGFSSLLLSAAAAALVGGVNVRGGRGTVLNIAIGVTIVSAVAAGLAATQAAYFVTQLVTGLLLFAVVTLEFLMAWSRGHASWWSQHGPRQKARSSPSTDGSSVPSDGRVLTVGNHSGRG